MVSVLTRAVPVPEGQRAVWLQLTILREVEGVIYKVVLHQMFRTHAANECPLEFLGAPLDCNNEVVAS